jgi:hypothetical protein
MARSFHLGEAAGNGIILGLKHIRASAELCLQGYRI